MIFCGMIYWPPDTSIDFLTEYKDTYLVSKPASWRASLCVPWWQMLWSTCKWNAKFGLRSGGPKTRRWLGSYRTPLLSAAGLNASGRDWGQILDSPWAQRWFLNQGLPRSTYKKYFQSSLVDLGLGEPSRVAIANVFSQQPVSGKNDEGFKFHWMVVSNKMGCCPLPRNYLCLIQPN